MTDKINITRCTDERMEEMVAFITRMNEDPQHHIAYFGAGEADIRASLSENTLPLTDSFFLAYRGSKLIGVFGLDVNPEIGRAWLLGPLVDDVNWHQTADMLFAEIQKIIPADIHQYDLYFDEKNENLHAFAGRHGFNFHADSAIYFVTRASYPQIVVDKSLIVPYDESYFEQFAALHDKTFPNTYYTAKQIIEKLDADRRLFIAAENGKLLGYNFYKLEDGFGYIDFLGVDESARRHGVASALLASSLDWMLAQPSISRVNLTMNTDRLPAKNLYAKFGFACERIACGYRKHSQHV